MKKFINIALCLSVIAGAIPMGASAKSEPTFLETGPDHWEMTSISGDINGDGKISVADALLLQRCFMDKYDYLDKKNFNKFALDINFDGSFDAFDLVQIRKLVLNPEQAEKQTYAVDILNTDAEIPTYKEKTEIWGGDNLDNLNKIITTYDEMNTYLRTFITDKDELQKYLDKYDETFFEENNLILEPFIQERGNGILTVAGATYKLNNISFKGITIDNGVFFYIGSNYKEDMGLYPITNTKMLAQISIPKSQTSAEDEIFYLDIQDGLLSEQNETVSYTDGTHEIVITQESYWGLNVNIYIKNDDNSFTYVTSIYPDSYFEDGEFSTENYTITFCDEAFIIDYLDDERESCKLQSSYDGEKVIEFNPYDTSVYKSPDGKTELYFNNRYVYNGNGGAIIDNTFIDMYIKQPDGYLKYFNNLDASGYNRPFKESGEWSVDSDGNNVFSSDTYSITWLEDSIFVDYQYDGGNQWAKGEINFDGSATDILHYWK